MPKASRRAARIAAKAAAKDDEDGKPQTANALWSAFQDMQEREDWPAMVQLITDLLNDSHGTPNLHGQRGVAFFHLDEFDKALQDFDCAIRLDPNNSGAHYNRTNVLIEKCCRGEDLLDEARASLQRVHELDQGDRADALEDLSQRLDSIELANKTNQAIAHNDYHEVLRLCTIALKAPTRMNKSGSANFHSSRGWAHFQLDEYDKALLDLDLAITLHPSLSKAHYNRGAVLLEMCKRGENRFDNARASLRRTIDLEPTTNPKACLLYTSPSPRD